MNDNDIKKCKKNGYVWLDNCGIIIRVNKGSCLWPEKNQWGISCFHATRAAAQAAIDERVAKRKADAAHAKMLEDGKNQTTPITPEQAKMLREGDEFFYLQHGGGAPKYHVTLDKLKRSPDITKWKCFVNGLAYFTHEAAESALAKQKPCDSSQKWIERKIGDIIQVGDEVTDWKDGERIIAGKSIAGLPVKSSMTARYVNPLWVALQEAKKTPSPKAKKVDCFAAKPSGEPASRITAEEQQVKDGWTDEEIEKAAFKPREWTDMPQHIVSRNPGSKYHRTIHGVSEGTATVDVYNVLEAFGVTCPACQHAIKKLLCAGLRGKGSRLQDLTEAATSIARAIELEKQRCEGKENERKA